MRVSAVISFALLRRRRAHRAAAADRRVVEHDAAGAAGVTHATKAITAGLNHGAALGVAGSAGQAASITGHFAIAHSHGQCTVAYDHAVHETAAGAEAVLHHHAEVLQHVAGNLIVAAAGDLHATGALLKAEHATGDHEVVRADRHGGRHARHRRHARHSHVRHAHLRAFHHHRAHA